MAAYRGPRRVMKNIHIHIVEYCADGVYIPGPQIVGASFPGDTVFEEIAVKLSQKSLYTMRIEDIHGC